jgi:hypothetical protein
MSLIDNPLIGVTIVSVIVFAAAFTLLALLVYKGWKTNTMRGYLLIYCCLFNMAAVWACQTPLFWISPIDYYLQIILPNVLKLMPMSTFFFSLKYFKVVTELVPLQERTRKIF